MIRIKDYIFNENDIRKIYYNKDCDTLCVGFRDKDLVTNWVENATFEDIEWNYDSQVSSQVSGQVKKLEEDNRELIETNMKLAIKNKEIEEENKKLKEENKHIFANVNDDELLRSNAMNYAEAIELRQRIDEAVEYLEHEQFKRTILGFGRDKYLDAMKNKTIRILKGKRKWIEKK